MYNYFMLVGTITSVDVKNNIKFDLAVGSPFKNEKGEYDVETFKLSFRKFDKCAELLTEGTKLGVKGHLQVRDDKILTIVDRIQFMADNFSESQIIYNGVDD